jgi:hypothetical protein
MQPLIAEYAIMQLKKSGRAPIQVTPEDIRLFNEILRESLKSFAGSLSGDVYISDIINDFEA